MGAPASLNPDQGIDALRAGGVVAYPTEGVWGLGCLPEFPHAVRRLLNLKQRDPNKGLILIAARVDDLQPYLQPLAADARAVLEDCAHPTTWLVPAQQKASEFLRGDHSTQAVRITRHATCRTLCQAVGALISTSANPEGAAPARSPKEVAQMFGAGLDGIIEGALGGAPGPSEIRDLRTGEVVRPAVAA